MIIGRAKDNWDRRMVAVAQPWPRPGLQGYQVDPGSQHYYFIALTINDSNMGD